MEQAAEHLTLGRRDGAELACVPRELEHQHQQLAAQLRLLEGHAARQEARLQGEFGYIYDECILARVLPGLLLVIHTGEPHPDRGEE